MVELRKRTDQLPDDYWVVLVGDMITEEALPTYMAMLNTLDGVRDETGAANTPWGRYGLAVICDGIPGALLRCCTKLLQCALRPLC